MHEFVLQDRRLIQIVAGLAAVLLLTEGAAAVEVKKHSNDSKTLNAILLEGDIETGDDLKFAAYMSRLPNKKSTAVYLKSGGGNLFTGLELGRMFHDYKIKTVVEGDNGLCASACALAFLGGIDKKTGKPWRTKSSTSMLGFHSVRQTFEESAYTAQDMTSAVEGAQRIVFEVVEYFQYIGVDLKFVPIMFKAPSHEMNWISNADALKLGIHVWDETAQGMITVDALQDATGTIPR